MTLWKVEFFKDGELVRTCWTKYNPEDNPTVILWNNAPNQTTHSERYEELEKLKGENMMNPSKIVKFIEENELGYILGNTVRAIIYSRDPESRLENQIQHLKDARAFLNVEIKRLGKEQEKRQNEKKI